MGNKKYYSWLIMLGVAIGFAIGFWRGDITESVNQKQIEESLEKDEHYLYFYEQLKQPQQQAYQRMLYVLTHQLDHIFLENTRADDAENILTYLLYDHPELFYVNSQFEYREENKGIQFFPKYDYRKEEVEKLNQQIENKIKPVINEAKQYETSILQAKYLYDYLIQNVEYQENKKIDQNIISSLLKGKSVCAGYARAYQYLLAKLDIESVYMIGTTKTVNSQTLKGDGHAWVMVKMNDDYYYCDPTWGDVAEKGMQHTCYGYFMMNSREMLQLYDVEENYQETKSGFNIYFAEMGCYLKEYDEKRISDAIKAGLDKGNHVAEIKCENEIVYEKIKSAIENSYLGYHMLQENDCWSNDASYACFDNLKLIEFYY